MARPEVPAPAAETAGFVWRWMRHHADGPDADAARAALLAFDGLALLRLDEPKLIAHISRAIKSTREIFFRRIRIDILIRQYLATL